MADEQQMIKAYEPAEVEAKWYPIWEKSGCFHGVPDKNRKSYSIVIPPPNVTGVFLQAHLLLYLCHRIHLLNLWIC